MRKFGNTRMEIKRVGFGGIPIQRISQEDTNKVIDELEKCGVNFIDTARGYTISEEYLGNALKGRREKFYIATKSMSRDYESMKNDIEISLKNLQTDYIDLYYQHRIDPKVEPEVVAGVMKELIAAGKIKAWGISETTEEYLRRAHAVCPVTAIQNRYSMMARWYEDLFGVCKELGITYVAFSPMANGLLSGKFTPDSTFENGDFRNNMPQYQKEGYEKAKKLLNLLKVLSEKKNCTMAQLSIAWMLRKKDFIVPIPGSRKLERLEENFRAGEIEVTIDEIKEIDALLDTIDFDVFGGH